VDEPHQNLFDSIVIGDKEGKGKGKWKGGDQGS